MAIGSSSLSAASGGGGVDAQFQQIADRADQFSLKMMQRGQQEAERKANEQFFQSKTSNSNQLASTAATQIAKGS